MDNYIIYLSHRSPCAIIVFMITKVCTQCHEEKCTSQYNKHQRTSDGLAPNCKECHKKYTRDWYRKNKKRRKETNRRWIEENRDRWNELKLEGYYRNLEKSRKYGLKHTQRRSRYKRHKISLMHKDEIDLIYKNRPKGHHVDHIVPLQGKNVCGLHVPWNLQYLPAEENLRKSNKVL